MIELRPERKQDTAEALWRLYRQRPTLELRELLIRRYVRLAKYVVDRMTVSDSGCYSKDDLIGHAILGLIESIERYDPARGVKFETYAVTRIRGEVVDQIRRLDWVPRSVRQKEKEVRDAHARLERVYGRPATDEEVADELGLPWDVFEETLKEIAEVSFVSLDGSFDGGEETVTIGELLAGDSETPSGAEFGERKRLLAAAIGDLAEKERLVVGLYYYEGLTLKEIGQVLGVTEARVSQIHSKAVTRLRARLSVAEAVFV
jgi:RNA polymerase sigma factor for flagellar operon FliA